MQEKHTVYQEMTAGRTDSLPCSRHGCVSPPDWPSGSVVCSKHSQVFNGQTDVDENCIESPTGGYSGLSLSCEGQGKL